MTDDYAAWLAENPAPDLQAFVRKYGDYRRVPPETWVTYSESEQASMIRNGVFSLVTPEEWLAYDRAVKAWQLQRRERYGGAIERPIENRAKRAREA